MVGYPSPLATIGCITFTLAPPKPMSPLRGSFASTVGVASVHALPWGARSASTARHTSSFDGSTGKGSNRIFPFLRTHTFPSPFTRMSVYSWEFGGSRGSRNPKPPTRAITWVTRACI